MYLFKMYILAYIIFLSILFFITFRVGWVFYKNGEVFIKALLPGDLHLVQSINKLLLAGYYLTNFGYVTLNISSWEPIPSFEIMCEVLFMKAGGIILLLGLMHYLNMACLLIYTRTKNLKYPGRHNSGTVEMNKPHPQLPLLLLFVHRIVNLVKQIKV